MPDITMCSNFTCPHKTKCYRNAASGTIPSFFQSFNSFKPGNDGNCTHFKQRETN